MRSDFVAGLPLGKDCRSDAIHCKLSIHRLNQSFNGGGDGQSWSWANDPGEWTLNELGLLRSEDNGGIRHEWFGQLIRCPGCSVWRSGKHQENSEPIDNGGSGDRRPGRMGKSAYAIVNEQSASSAESWQDDEQAEKWEGD